MPGNMALALGGSRGEGDLIELCEAAFDVEIAEFEAGSVSTVGELYDVISDKCRDEASAALAPARAGALALLRAHFRGRSPVAEIRPGTCLNSLFGPDPRAEWRALRAASGFALPRLALSEAQTVFLSIVLALGLAGAVWGGLFLASLTQSSLLGAVTGLSILALAGGFVLYDAQNCSRSLPPGIETVSDLACLMASPQTGWLQPRRRRTPADLWAALECVVRQEACHEGPVTRDLAVVKVVRGGERV